MSTRMVTTATPRILVQECKRMGVSQIALLEGTGLSAASIQNAPGYIPAEQLYVLWDKIIRLTGNEMFGLHAAEKVPFGAYRVHDYMVSLSASPCEAMERIDRSFTLTTDVFRHSVRQHRDLAYLELHSAEGPQDLPRPYIEFILANYLVRLRMATQTRFTPAEVHLTCQKPPTTREYDRFFGAHVRFRQAVNRLVFPQRLMDIPHPLADRELCELLENYAQRRLRQLSIDRPLREIHDALARNLEMGETSLAKLARLLARSPRSLQREFHAHGMTFRALLDRIRQERALALLTYPDLPVKEIARKLQFADASAFCRAFQRWTGVSANHYRNHAEVLSWREQEKTTSE